MTLTTGCATAGQKPIGSPRSAAQDFVRAALTNDRAHLAALTKPEIRYGAIDIARELRRLVRQWHLGKPSLEARPDKLYVFAWKGHETTQLAKYRTHVGLSLNVELDRGRWVVWQFVIFPTEDPIK